MPHGSNGDSRSLIGCHHAACQMVFSEIGSGRKGSTAIAGERARVSPSSAFFDIGTAWRPWNARNLHIGSLYQWASLD
jgi:hypothetical protein